MSGGDGPDYNKGGGHRGLFHSSGDSLKQAGASPDRTRFSHISELQLQLEDQEDRGCRNKLKGVPEADGPENLQEKVTAILEGLLRDPNQPAPQHPH